MSLAFCLLLELSAIEVLLAIRIKADGKHWTNEERVAELQLCFPLQLCHTQTAKTEVC